jgi:hypothetical protein
MARRTRFRQSPVPRFLLDALGFKRKASALQGVGLHFVASSELPALVVELDDLGRGIGHRVGSSERLGPEAAFLIADGTHPGVSGSAGLR